MCLQAYLKNELVFVADVVRSYPRGLGGGHLDDDTPDAPDITLPAVPHVVARVIDVASSYHLEGGRAREGR